MSRINDIQNQILELKKELKSKKKGTLDGIGVNIKHHRKELGLTQQDLADLIGTAKATEGE